MRIIELNRVKVYCADGHTWYAKLSLVVTGPNEATPVIEPPICMHVEDNVVCGKLIAGKAGR
jgi:hypothetical protein